MANNFVETATLKLLDQASKPAALINRELTKLWQTTQKLRKVQIRIDVSAPAAARTQAAIRGLQADLAKLRSSKAGVRIDVANAAQARRAVRDVGAELAKLRGRRGTLAFGVGNLANARAALTALERDLKRIDRVKATLAVNSSQVQMAITRLEKLRRLAGTPVATTNVRANVAGGGGQPSVPSVPSVPGGRRGRQPGNVFWTRFDDSNAAAAGRIMARSFVAVAGVEIATVLRRTLAAGGRGVVDRDTARANIEALGLNANQVEASAARAAAGTEGVTTSEIMTAAGEQIAALQAQLNSGAISAEEFAARMDATTKRVASTAQALGTIRGDFTRGAEDARQIEKAIALTRAGLDPEQQKVFRDAILKAVIASGGDVSGEEIKRMLQQYGSALAAGLSPEGVARLALIRDEGGRQSTAEIRQMLNDLFRGNLNEADMAAQERAGLRRQGRTTVEKDLFEDPVRLVQERLAPLAKAAKVDTSDAVALQEFFDNVVGLTTSGAKFAARATQAMAQYENELVRFRTTDPTAIEGGTIASGLAEVNTAFQDAFGNLTQAMASTVVSALGSVTRVIEAIGGGTLPEGKDLAAVGLGGAAAAGAIAAPGFVLNKLFNPLNGSAVALNGSAAALDGAAAALMRAAGAQGAGALPEGVDGGNRTMRPGRPPSPGRGAATGTLGLVAGAAVYGEQVAEAAVEYFTGATPEQQQATREQATDRGWMEIKSSIAALVDSFRGDGKQGPVPVAENVQVAKEIAALRAERSEIAASIASLEAEIARNKAAEKLPGTSDIQNVPLAEKLAAERLNMQTVEAQLTEMDANWRQIFNEGAAMFNTSLATGGQAVQTSLDTGFAAGAATITQSGPAFGQAAGGVMAAFGTQFGQAAAAQISTAVSNLNINVRQPAQGPDVGKQLPQ